MNDIEWQRPDLRPHIKRISAAAGWRWRQRFSPRGALRRRVAGQVVLITGASSGIGAGLSHRLARAGATVLLVARSLDKLQDTVDDIRADGGRAHAYRCDLADLDSCDRLCEQVLAEHGGVDILVNNAGRSIRRSVMHSLDRFHDYQRTMQL
ncbi:MAG TPA: NAD-dependent epimerase, partial [Alcanivorax sp.]|nr:NAD-dependent epimerase [Alcanivorax sp.]